MLFLLGRNHYNHSLAFKQRHLLYLAVLFEVVGKTQQQHLALLFEKNRAAFEEHICLHFSAFLKEAYSVLEFEVVVVVVGLGSESDLLHNPLG